MPVTRTNTKRYVALCPVADCGWQYGPHSVRLTVSQHLRDHTRQTHGFVQVEPTPERTHAMKVQKNTELPEQAEGDRLQNYAGELVVFRKGWEHVTEGDRIRSKFGDRPFIEADVYVYDTDAKVWRNPGMLRVYWATIIARLLEEGSDDDIGGVLTQGTKRNSREWDLTPPSTAQVKLLEKFDPSF